jgi:hypothetical protein
MALIIAPLLFIAAVIYTTYPLLREGKEGTHQEERQDEREKILEEKKTLITSLKDIEMDYRMGKLSREDYGELKASFEQRAVKVYQALEVLAKKETSKRKKR